MNNIQDKVKKFLENNSAVDITNNKVESLGKLFGKPIPKEKIYEEIKQAYNLDECNSYMLDASRGEVVR